MNWHHRQDGKSDTKSALATLYWWPKQLMECSEDWERRDQATGLSVPHVLEIFSRQGGEFFLRPSASHLCQSLGPTSSPG